MKFLKWLFIIAIVVTGGAYLYGRSLPREHTASSTITLVASADTVWKVVRNVRGTVGWWSGMKSATRVTDAARETWDEDMGTAGVLRIEITAEEPPRRLVTTILDTDKLGWGGSWTYTITPTSAGTEITITEDGFVDMPIFRVVMKAIGKHRTMDSYLRDLGGHFGEPMTPRHGDAGGA